jgi:hypothetical protein
VGTADDGSRARRAGADIEEHTKVTDAPNALIIVATRANDKDA